MRIENKRLPAIGLTAALAVGAMEPGCSGDKNLIPWETGGLDSLPPLGSDDDGDGYDSDLYGGTDCDDNNAAINPGVEERCDTIDNDCDGVVDENCESQSDGDLDGSTEATGDCDDGDASINPGAAETCDDANVDEDCDGLADDADTGGASGLHKTWYADADGDGYGDPDNKQSTCDRPDGTVADNTDCDDSDAAVNPGATETRDGIDNDCDPGNDRQKRPPMAPDDLALPTDDTAWSTVR